MEINERLKIIRHNFKLNQKQFSNTLGVNQSFYSEVENNKRPVSNKILNSLLVNFNVSSDWMLTGKGDIYITNIENNMTGKNDGNDDGNSKNTHTRNPHLDPHLNSKKVNISTKSQPEGQSFEELKATILKSKEEYLKKLYEDPNWKEAQNLKLKIYDKIKSDKKVEIDVFKNFRSNIAKLLKFVNAIDYLFTADIERVLYEKLNAGSTKEELSNFIDSYFVDLLETIKILSDFNSSTELIIKRLTEFDKTKELISDGNAELNSFILSQEYDKASIYRDKLAVHKKYIIS